MDTARDNVRPLESARIPLSHRALIEALRWLHSQVEKRCDHA